MTKTIQNMQKMFQNMQKWFRICKSGLESLEMFILPYQTHVGRQKCLFCHTRRASDATGATKRTSDPSAFPLKRETPPARQIHKFSRFQRLHPPSGAAERHVLEAHPHDLLTSHSKAGEAPKIRKTKLLSPSPLLQMCLPRGVIESNLRVAEASKSLILKYLALRTQFFSKTFLRSISDSVARLVR